MSFSQNIGDRTNLRSSSSGNLCGSFNSNARLNSSGSLGGSVGSIPIPGSNSLEKTIQSWVELDNELKRMNERLKDIRTRKNDVEDKIMTYVENNNMSNSFINISDGKLKFCETKQTSPLTLGFLEKCLSEVIANQGQVKQIVDYIKSKRETKTVPEIKRYYNG